MKHPLTHRHTIVHGIFSVLFLLYVGIGFRVYQDYGVPIDEYSQAELGRVNYERIVAGNPEIQTQYDRYYGPAFEVPLYVFSTVMQSSFGIDRMNARHLGIFLFFAFSLVLFYRFLANITGHPGYGAMGAALLVLSPRFFAESFYNTKDIAFLSATILILWAYARPKKPVWIWVVVLAAATGFAIAVRAQGLLLFAVCIIAVLFTGTETRRVRIQTAGIYSVLTLGFAFAMFPVFWNDTIRNVIGFFRSSANPVGVPTYYFGKFYVSPSIPWHYHFVWVAISSLLSVVVTGVAGICWFVYSRGKKAADEKIQPYVVMALIIAGTFLTSVFFHPRSYDGWRHIYYIYPCLIGFSVYMLKQCQRYVRTPVGKKAFYTLTLLICADVLSAAVFMVRNHPNEYVYFNALAGNYTHAKANFDFDYWGISQKQIFEYLMSLPVTKPATVYFEQVLPYTDAVMIPFLQNKGIRAVPSVEEADVYVTINRDFKDPPPPQFRKIYAVTIEGADASAVYVRDGFVL